MTGWLPCVPTRAGAVASRTTKGQNVSQYELIDGATVFETWGREADPTKPRTGLLAQMTQLVEQRWGRTPSWVQTDTGWRAA